MYILRGNTIRNNARSDANAAQKQWLQDAYGKNWERGVEADPTVERYNPDKTAANRLKTEQKKNEGYRETVKESIGELAQKRTISGSQAQRLANIADQT